MTPEQYEKAGRLYDAALGMNPESRGPFLDVECGPDEELRHEVESLLAAHDKVGDYFGSPALEVAARLVARQENLSLAGQAFSHYRVLSLIGAGGMGEVYLAEDTRLGRKVALKILPKDSTQDQDRVRRFEQEARAASALNHPNIVTIYEVGQIEERHFIAIEYIEGQTLRGRLSDGQMELREAVEIGAQMASALEAAHEAGIVHRDIKPENVMVRRDGLVKVLDFGLAKLAESKRRDAGPNLTGRVNTDTSPGLLLGTVRYMSPEQARGLAVDARSDVFSLGTVIYEMIAGQVPFEGATTSDIIVSILERDPAPLSRYWPGVPAELERIVVKALGKKRDERYQSAGDLAIDLKSLKQEIEVEARLKRTALPGSEIRSVRTTKAGQAAVATQENLSVRTDDLATARSAAATGISKKSMALVAALVIVLSVGALLGFKLVNTTAKPAAVNSYNNWEVVRLTRTGSSVAPAISPDGKYVAYVQRGSELQSVWIQQLATYTEHQILPPEKFAYYELFFSPDGSELYFSRRENPTEWGSVYRVPMLGGAPKKLQDKVEPHIALSPDGARLYIFSHIRNRSDIITTDGVEERALTSEILPFPAVSPDGKVIAYTVGNTSIGNDSMSIYEHRLEDGTKRGVGSRQWNFVGHKSWLPDGTGLIVSAREAKSNVNQLWFVGYPSGEARPLSDKLNHLNHPRLTADARMLVAEQVTSVSEIWSLPLLDTASARKIGVWGQAGLSLLKDGRILYTALPPGENHEIWVMNGDGTGRKQLTFDSSNDLWPVASPDERYIIFTSNRSGEAEAWRMNLDGSNPLQLTNEKAVLVPSLTPDSRWVIYCSGRDACIWKVPIEGGESVRVVKGASNATAVSPDGKLIAYIRQNQGGWGIGVNAFADGTPVTTFDGPSFALNNNFLKWTADGKALLYACTYEGASNIWMQRLDSSAPKRVTDFKEDGVFSFDVSADGKTLVCARGDWKHDIVLVKNLR